MKSVKILWLAAAVLFLCACPATAYIEFKDGLTHNINYRIDENVLVDYQAPNMYTTANLLEGGYIDDSLLVYEHGRINIQGGYTNTLRSRNYSQVDISGGSILITKIEGSSQVNISGGKINWLGSWDSSQVNISGGLSNIFSHDSSYVNISGGQVNGINILNSSRANISGGSIGSLYIDDSSHVDISGGLIIYYLQSWGHSHVDISGGSIGGDLVLANRSMIQIFGSDFAVDGQAVGYGELTSLFGGSYWNEPFRRLTGTLARGGIIDTDFRIGYDAKIILVPEPATVLLLGLGGLFLRRRK